MYTLTNLISLKKKYTNNIYVHVNSSSKKNKNQILNEKDQLQW